jgi:hypothetical protein
VVVVVSSVFVPASVDVAVDSVVPAAVAAVLSVVVVGSPVFEGVPVPAFVSLIFGLKFL